MESWISGLNMLLHRSVERTVPCDGSLQVVTGRLLLPVEAARATPQSDSPQFIHSTHMTFYVHAGTHT